LRSRWYKFNKFIADTPIVDSVVFRPAPASEPPGPWCHHRLPMRSARIAIVGDSAGGGLTLATLADLRDRRRVAAAVLFSPWTDLTLGGRSIQEKAHSDVLLDPQ
jgi:alpha-beta hydrolase superfamily lysophospholipase